MEIFTNPEILEESYEDSSLTSRQTREKERIKARVDSYVAKNRSEIIGIVGVFGSGKSTVIDQIIEDDHGEEYKWLKFDIWRYSDRQQIWDGFVIEVMASLIPGNESIQKKEMQVVNELDGESKLTARIKAHPIRFFSLITLIWLAVGIMIWSSVYQNNEPLALFVKALLKYGIAILFVLCAFLGLNTLLSKNNPLKRLFEFEAKLEESLANLSKPLIVIVEDVDRASEEGVVFMETLKEFLKKINKKDLSYPLIIIAPQSKTYLDVANENTLQGFERGIKIYDSIIHYEGSVLKPEEVLEVISAAGLTDTYVNQFNMTVSNILNTYRKQLSLRTVKFVLREVDEFVKAYSVANPSIVFILIIARYIKILDSNQKYSTALSYISSKNQFHLADSDEGVKSFIRTLCYLVEDTEPGGVRVVRIEFGQVATEIDGTIDYTSRLRLDEKYEILMER